MEQKFLMNLHQNFSEPTTQIKFLIIILFIKKAKFTILYQIKVMKVIMIIF